MEKILFLYFLISLIYCEEYYYTFKKDKLYNDKCALFISKNDNLTLILNSESDCLDECIVYESEKIDDIYNGFCYNSYDFEKLSGEKCNGNDDCISKNCTDNVCIGKFEKDECEENAECDLGLYCDIDNKCEKLKDEGENCHSLYEDFLKNMNDNCYAGLVCNNDKCVKLGSLSYDNEYSGQIDNEFSCKSGVEKGGNCIDYVSEQVLEDSSENQCLLKYTNGNYTKYKIQDCEKNLIGNNVAAWQIHFDNFQNYVKEYNKQLQEIGKEKVHVLNKLSLGNKSLLHKYLDSIIGEKFDKIDKDYKILYYNNYLELNDYF